MIKFISLWLLIGFIGFIISLTWDLRENPYEVNYFDDSFMCFIFVVICGPISFIVAIVFILLSTIKKKVLKDKKFDRWLWEKLNKEYRLKNKKQKEEDEMFKFLKRLAVFIFIITVILLLIFPMDVNAKELEKSRTTQYEFTEQESLELQKIAIAEAQTEGIGGMAFVMQTVLNRVESPDFPNTIYGVISESGQFTSFSNGMYDKAQPTENSQKALDLLNILQNQGQLYFEVTTTDSWQYRNLIHVFTYNKHSFYR